MLLSAEVAPSSKLAALQSCQTGTTTCPVFTIPTGTVAFTDNSGSSPINTAVINAEGDAEFKTAYSVGAHSITASYGGDQSYNASTAAAIKLTIVQDSPNVYLSGSTLSGAQNGVFSFVQGQPTTFYVLVENSSAVTGEAAAPTGSVSLSSSPSLGTASSAVLVAGVDPSTGAPDGIAAFTVPATASARTYNVTLTYNGDTNYSGTGGLLGQIIITAASGKASSITATAGASATSPNAAVQVAGTVTGQSGTAAPTGTVDFFSSGNDIGSITLSAPTSGFATSFSVALTSQILFQGANSITVQYSGDSNYKPSSTIISVANPLADFSMIPETTIIPVAVGASATDTINVSSVNGFAGAVNFTCATSTVNCTVTSSATLTAGSGSSPLTLTINAGSSAPNGSYNVLITGKDSTGQYVHTLGIQAEVTGSTSTASFSLTANPTTIPAITNGATGTSVITVAPTNGFIGTVGLGCTVSGPSGATNPKCVMAPTSVDISAATGVTSTLIITTAAATTAGNYTITVTGTSAGLTENTTVGVTVNNPAGATFSLSGSAATAISSPGGTTTSTITVASSTGFTGSVALTCAITTSPSGASNLPGCTFTPTTASTTATSTMTVTTTAATSGALQRPLDKFFALGGGIAVAGLLLFTIPARRRSWRSILGVLVFAAMVGMGIGCGSGGGNSGGGSSGTTTGAYVVTVTGTSGSLSTTTPVNVTVN